MPPMVRTRSTTAVPLRAAGDAELPDPGRLVRLPPFDAYWVALPPVRRVFLFRSLPGVPFSDVVGKLRSSLAQVLPAFHLFAGELTYSPDSRALSIVLPDERVGYPCGGVTVVEAETDLDFERLVEEGAEHDEDALRQLVPDIRRDQLPALVMAAQVTEFVGGIGGVALGVTVHHTAADGRGLWRFLEMWAAAAAGVEAGPVPLHDRRHGDEELARLFLLQLAPSLPKIAPKQDPALDARRRLSRRTFTLAASAVRNLNLRLASEANIGTAPSTFARVGVHRARQRLRQRRRTGVRCLPRGLPRPYVATGAGRLRRQLRRALHGVAERVGTRGAGRARPGAAGCEGGRGGGEARPARRPRPVVQQVRGHPAGPRGRPGGVAVVPRVRAGLRVREAGEGGPGVHEPRRRDGARRREGGRLGAGVGGACRGEDGGISQHVRG